MTTVVITAVGSSLGLLGLVAALRDSPRSLRAALADIERNQAPAPLRLLEADRRIGLRVDRHLGNMIASMISKQDLAAWIQPLLSITGTLIEVLCGEIVLGALVGFVLPGAWWMVVAAAGIHLSFLIPLWAALGCACGGAALPVLILRARAIRARRSARRIVGSFLNMVVLCLAGGMGIEGALYSSARIGDDAVSERILSSLVVAQNAGDPPWGALDHLGRELGLTELTELAAAVGLAGGEGARIRATLAAKAQSIRRRDLAEAESDANAVTERLFLPGVFLLLGFLVFIAYPAVERISVGL